MFPFLGVLVLVSLFYCSFFWSGGCLVVRCGAGYGLLLLSLATLLFVFLRETRYSLLGLASVLCFMVYIFVVLESYLFFYLVLEVTLFPLLLLLLAYGAQPQKVGASSFLVFYGVLRRVPLLWRVLSLGGSCLGFFLSGLFDTFVLVFLSLGFLMKLPVYLLHSWLPRVHVEAPTSARVVLAAVLLKMGA